MNIFRFVTGCVVFTVCAVGLRAARVDTTLTSRPVLEGMIYTEANYGYRFSGDNRSRRDFPHIVANATLALGRGWTIEAEMEYERMHENGEWCNDHWDNFATNKLYADKQWSDALGLKFGIVEVPLGITNAGGPALTIYDPVSEAALMPMTWHETGVALHGCIGRWSYELSALVYVTTPASDCRTVGVAATAHWMPADGLSVGGGVFRGRADNGCLRRCSPDFIGGGALTYGVADAVYEHEGWTVGGSFIYCNRGNARSAGAEAGYDVMRTAGVEGCALTPFVRYDGVFGIAGEGLNRLTAGLNLKLFDALTVKAEYGRCRHGSMHTEHTLDVSVGYELKF